MHRLSSEPKLAIAAVVLTTGAALAGAVLVGGLFEREVEQVGTQVLQGALQEFSREQAAEVEKLAATLDVLMASERLREAFVARDRERLLAAAEPIFDTLRERDLVSHWYFTEPDPSRRVFLRVHRPELYGDRVDRITMTRAADSGELGAGLELGKTAFALRVVRPWFVDGKLIGYMELAQDVDLLLASMRNRSGDEYGLLLLKKFLDQEAWAKVLGGRANTWNDRADVVAVDASAFADGIMQFSGDVETLPTRGQVLGESSPGGRTFLSGVYPLDDAAGRRVGAIFVAHDFTAHHQAVQAGRRYALAVFLLLALVTAGGFALLARRLAFRPLRELRERLERRAAGDPVPGALARLESADDLGRIEVLVARAPREAPPAPGAAAPGERPAGEG
jgi:hypothetical protein